MKSFLPLGFLCLFLLSTTANSMAQGQAGTYIRLYDLAGAVVEGSSEVSAADNKKLIEIQAVSSSLFCGTCTSQSATPGADPAKVEGNSISFSMKDGQQLKWFKDAINSGASGKLCFLYSNTAIAGSTAVVGKKNDYYVMVIDLAAVQNIAEAKSEGGDIIYQVTMQFGYVAYYYRRPNATTHQLPETPTSVVTWDYVHKTTALPSGKATLPTGF